jgi:hypothetical protein
MRLMLPLLAACALTACGNDAPKAPAAPKASADERVIRAWTDDLRKGDEAAAAARFALPAVVANGTKPLELTTREQIRAFQDSLTCGAILVAAEPHQGVTIARFRLTDRPGGNCGDGAGGYAAAVIEVRDGRIVRWLRLEDPEAPPPSGPLV